MTRIIEDFIRSYPAEWLWIQRRWCWWRRKISCVGREDRMKRYKGWLWLLAIMLVFAIGMGFALFAPAPLPTEEPGAQVAFNGTVIQQEEAGTAPFGARQCGEDPDGHENPYPVCTRCGLLFARGRTRCM